MNYLKFADFTNNCVLTYLIKVNESVTMRTGIFPHIARKQVAQRKLMFIIRKFMIGIVIL